MSSNSISLIILIFSFFGLIFLIIRKIPALLVLAPETAAIDKISFFSKIKNSIKNIPGLKNFSPEVFLQKIISQIRVLSLKTDHKTAGWLKNLRQKNQKKKLENGEYWEDLKNSKDKK